jgi:AAA+ ATPase superfamily predicted ATPase
VSTTFVNREDELAQLQEWWSKPGPHFGIVWGRRRVGKTFLLQEFSKDLRSVFFTAQGGDPPDELANLTRQAAGLTPKFRDLSTSPFRDWQDAFETFATAAEDEPLLVVLDEFPELRAVDPGLEGILRAFWDRVAGTPETKLRILLTGSAVRTMEAIQEHRAPLFGRFDLTRLIHPFRPHEAALMLQELKPADRALVWGMVGGMPAYLSWWNQKVSVKRNLHDLVCTPGGRLLEAGAYLLETEGAPSGLARQILYAIATGKTRFAELKEAVSASPAQISTVLRNLEALRLVERQVPVTEDPRKTQGGRTSYQIADNFLAFWLGTVARFRGEIDRGLGDAALSAILDRLDDHMGTRYEEAFRDHLRRMAGTGDLGQDIIAVGRFWSRREDDPNEIDAVVLAGSPREAVLVGEAKWARKVDGARIRQDLERKSSALPRVSEDLRFAACAREEVDGPDDVLPVTAEDIFS